jgi:hypothetical protein
VCELGEGADDARVEEEVELELPALSLPPRP